MTKKEGLLVDWCRTLKMRKEPIIAVMAWLRTDKQQGTMLDWVLKHYKEHPTEDQILEIAETIAEQVH